MKLLVVFIASFLVAVCGQNQNLCGRNLATALANLCGMNMIKRARGQDLLVRDQDPLARELGRLQFWPWMSRHRTKSLGRSKRQIVSECCEKACSNEELLSYCDY
ncbi:insulin-related peptide 4-like [Aricia agestis]|uniref:insulin-related peptide 4-like n=1 Tax=Aricia agestis TaxID=91739 RepID=UPI001C20192F|nr:insulin-related peptide 4-like [Aricia agestis]